MWRDIAGLSIAALLGPIALMTCYLIVSRRHEAFDTWYDLPATATCIAFGVVAILMMPMRRWYRLVLGLIYLPVMTLLLASYSFSFIGHVYGSWL